MIFQRRLYLFLICVGLCSQPAFAEISLFGFIKASVPYAIAPIASNGRNNFVAYNSAANPLFVNNQGGSYSFQVEQTRLGLEKTWQENFSALVEVDFVDFNKSSPTVAAQPRLRRASMTYARVKDWSFVIGQDWDLFSPLSPFTYNLIGHYFLSGDVGFMRQQWQVHRALGTSRLSFALGFPTSNNSQSVGGGERSDHPSLAASWSHKTGGSQRGLSVIYATQKEAIGDRNLVSYGINSFFQSQIGPVHLVSEVYYGQNLENIGLQALSYSVNGQNPKELGGFVTLRYHFLNWSLFSGYGRSQVLNPSEVAPSYVRLNGVPQSTVGSPQATGYGLLWNETIRVGADWQVEQNMNLFMEIANLQTQHQLDSLDQAVNGLRTSAVFELGIKVDL